jgi:hypothetical protein
MNGIASTLTTWNAGRARPTNPPRAVFTKLNRGASLGKPHDAAQQRRILEATLALLAHPAPLDIVRLDETAD